MRTANLSSFAPAFAEEPELVAVSRRKAEPVEGCDTPHPWTVPARPDEADVVALLPFVRSAMSARLGLSEASFTGLMDFRLPLLDEGANGVLVPGRGRDLFDAGQAVLSLLRGDATMAVSLPGIEACGLEPLRVGV